MKKEFGKKLISIMLSIILVVSYLPTSFIVGAAGTSASVTNAYNGVNNKIADPWTLDNWKQFFPHDAQGDFDTHYAGGVWTDKSVFNSADEYLSVIRTQEGADFNLDINDTSFLVALSAIASTKSVEGYTALPSDTILVLDLSASMITNQAVAALVTSANSAIDELLNLNANNRVGVVAYSGNAQVGSSNTSTAEVILPIGRYTKGLDNQNQGAYLVSSWRSNNQNRTGVKVANGVTAQIAQGVSSTFSTNNNKTASGGTYIQNGLYKAYEMFNEVEDTTILSGLQAGTKRVPVMVLLSDGAPTAATTNYTSVGNSNVGDGTSSYATVGTAFLTQLTASWVSDKLEEKYSNAPLFYTLGLNVGNNNAAKNVLDPSNNNGTDGYWQEFIDLKNKTNKTMEVGITDNREVDINYQNAVLESGWSEDYVTKYFPASNAQGLIESFNSIVQQIIVQSLYYPTMVESGNSINEDGFLVFEDYIGKNMEIKAIKGIQQGSKLYTGETLAKLIFEGGLGTQENPTDIGNNFIWSVQKRLGIENIADARALVGQAYREGQLFYNPDTKEFSNYIGWYADENETFLGFWDGKSTDADAVADEIKDRAVFAIKSYGYYDAVGEGHRKTDMMYATIQVRTNLKDSTVDASKKGETRLIGRLPASLVPLIEYDIDLNGTDPMNPSAMTANDATPSRLLYEVGLSSKIDLLNIEGTAPDALEKDSNGNYVFYTNQWDKISTENFSYKTNKNTLSFFEPSFENERYYYNYDTPIFTDTNGTLYKSNTAPTYDENNPLYHRTITYTKNGNNVTARYDYEKISEYVLVHTDDLAKLEDNSWVVKKGTLHHYFADYQINKLDNGTETREVSFMPFVHDRTVSSDTEHFHIDFYLGNNGRLTINADEGIKITKTSDDTLTDKTIEYEFIVSTDNTFNETLSLIKEDADKNRADAVDITFVNGKATVKLKHGETAYIIGAEMIGKTFKVSEIEGDGYVVASVNSITTDSTANITVTADTIQTAAFVNTKQHTGSVVIGKAVISNIEEHLDKEFDFTVTISGDKLKDGRNYVATRSDGVTYNLLKDTGVNIKLKHNQYITINALPEGTEVNAVETDYSSVGFTTNDSDQSKTVVADSTGYINFSNTYSAQSVDGGDIMVGGIKHFESDTNMTLDFEFKLQRYIWADDRYEDVTGATATVSYANSKGDRNFSFDFSNEPYTAAGTYYYRIVETLDSNLQTQGIIFDPTPAYFSVVVDDDKEGNLYIKDVVASTDTVVSKNGNVYDVVAEFTNTYSVDGAAEVILNMKKIISSEYGVTIPPAGFSFELYNANSQFVETGIAIKTSSVTGAGALSDIALVYTDPTNDIGEHYYVLKEYVPSYADKIKGVTYSQQRYGVKVVVGHALNKFTVSVTTYDLNGTVPQVKNTYNGGERGNNSVVANVSDYLEFTNTFTPEKVSFKPDLSGSKILNGRDMKNNEEFTFNLYKTDSTFNTTGLTAQESKTVSGARDGEKKGFIFSELTYDRPGTHYYVIKEDIPQGVDANNTINGLTYDNSEYQVVVTVVGNNQTGKLTASAQITKNGHNSVIEFVNTYSAKPATNIVIEGSKELLGNIRKLQSGAYSFELVNSAGDVIERVKNDVPTTDYAAPFKFAPLSFDSKGTYNYTVREVIPTDATAQNNFTVHGVKYDTAVFNVEVKVTDDGNGILVAQTNYTNGPVKFENEYNVLPTYIDFTGKKNLTGDAISKYTGQKAFKYELYAASWDNITNSVVQGALLKAFEENGSGEFSFLHSEITELNFDKIGAYRFIVKEHIPIPTEKIPLMQYDTSTYEIEVDVTDNLQGALVANKKITKIDEKGERSEVSSIEFNNTLKPEPIFAKIEGIKEYNLNLTDNMFTFELYQALLSSSGKINAIGDPVLEAKNKADGSFKFEEEMLHDELSGIDVKSTYITFDRAGTYYFVVKEKIPEGVDANNTLGGVTYDDNLYEIKIEVTESIDQSGRSILSYQKFVNTAANGSIKFTNSYNAVAQNGVIINAKKFLTGKNIKDEFEFGLYKVLVNPDKTIVTGNLIEKVKNVGNDVTFSEIKFTSYLDAGEHIYLVSEIIPDGVDENNTLDGLTYDDARYLVKFEVTDNGNGTMSVTQPTYIAIENDKVSDNEVNAITFVNVYTPKAINFSIKGQKILKEGEKAIELGDREFEFTIFKTEDKYLVSPDAAPLEVVKNNKDGEFEFKGLSAEKEGDLYFVVKENQSKYEDVKDDKTVYNVKVSVVNRDGTLVATSSIIANDKAVEAVTFTNIYTPKEEPKPPVETPEPPVETPEPPKEQNKSPLTGDYSNIFAWLNLMFISGGAGLVTVKKLKEQDEE